MEALIIQPNLDPYSEKFSDTGNALSTNQQLERMLQLAEEKITDKTQFVILPETALQGGMKESDLENEELVTKTLIKEEPLSLIPHQILKYIINRGSFLV